MVLESKISDGKQKAGLPRMAHNDHLTVTLDLMGVFGACGSCPASKTLEQILPQKPLA
jgi:hypothetical protein